MNKKINIGTKLGFGLGDLGGNLIFTTAGSFLTLYYTDSVLLSAAFVGTMMLVARLLDGISDIIMGTIIDHTNTKFGKARPYVLFGSFFLFLSFLLLFNVPGSMSDGGKKIYAAVTYIFMAVICYTVVNLAYTTLITLMTPDIQERASLSSFRTFFSFLAIMVINGFTPSLLEKLGGGQAGFTKMSIIYGIIALFCLVLSGIVGKEYQDQDEEHMQKVPMNEALKALFSTKYVPICGLAFVANWMLLAVNGSSMVYYARDVLHNIGFMGALSAAGTLPSLILLFAVPSFAVKIGKRKALIIGAIFETVAYLISFIAPTNIPVVITGCICRGIGLGFVNALLYASVADVCDYIALTTGKHIEGLTNSVISFGMKVGSGLGSAILGWLLAWGGYSEKLANAFQPQSAATVTAEIWCYAGVPAICGAVVLICVCFLNVEKKLSELRKN